MIRVVHSLRGRHCLTSITLQSHAFSCNPCFISSIRLVIKAKKFNNIFNVKQKSFSTYTNNQFINETDAEYGKTIFKKFMLHVHPDYFGRFKYEKSINETNLKILSSSSTASSSSSKHHHHHPSATEDGTQFETSYISESTRSLTFYLKSLQVDEKPRRVRVILSQRIESMREILETLGVDLPIRPDGMRQQYISTSDPEDLESFMDHLLERRDLLLWRTDRRSHFMELQNILRHTLGVQAIEFRYSWSAQNNSILIKALLSLIENHYQDLSLPWSGMSLVLSPDDTTHDPVEAVEAHVKINPADVPMQWLKIFQSVRVDTIARVQAVDQLLIEQAQYMEEIFSKSIKKFLSLRLRWSPVHTSQLQVVLVRGFTCSRGNMLRFLSNLQTSLLSTVPKYDSNNFSIVTELSDTNDNAVTDTTTATATATATDIANHLTVSKTQDTRSKMRGFDDRWTDALPLQIKVIVEEGHGTRLLESGEFRVDCRAGWTSIEQLLRNRILDSIEKTVARKLLLQRLESAKLRVRTRLNLVNIEAGVGVDDLKLESCLLGMESYLNQPSNKNGNGKLRGLTGVKVKIGKYLGMDDDGACILPWNLFEQKSTEQSAYSV